MATKKSVGKGKLSTAQKVSIGAGLTAAAVAAAGAYFLYGSKDAKKHRGTVKSWMLKAKSEVLETLEKAEDMTQAEYEKMIESVSGAYSRLKDASKVDIATFKREMKAHWPNIVKASKPTKKVVKAVKKVAKAPAKKVAKKTAKKVAVKAK